MQKIHPATRKKIEAAAASQAIEAYEKAHNLGKYAPKAAPDNTILKIEAPTAEELHELGTKFYRRLHDAFAFTDIEARKQKYAMAMFHMETAARYIDKALKN